MSIKAKKFKLPRGEDKSKRELSATGAWRAIVWVGALGFFGLFLWAYFYFLQVISLEETALSGVSAEMLRVVDQEELRRAIEIIENKEAGLGAAASSSPALVDPSR